MIDVLIGVGCLLLIVLVLIAAMLFYAQMVVIGASLMMIALLGALGHMVLHGGDSLPTWTQYVGSVGAGLLLLSMPGVATSDA